MFRFSPFLSQGDGVKNATKINPFEQFITKQLRPEKNTIQSGSGRENVC